MTYQIGIQHGKEKEVLQIMESLQSAGLLDFVKPAEHLMDEESQMPIEIEERLAAIQSFLGKAKYPDFPIDKYDVYDQ